MAAPNFLSSITRGVARSPLGALGFGALGLGATIGAEKLAERGAVDVANGQAYGTFGNMLMNSIFPAVALGGPQISEGAADTSGLGLGLAAMGLGAGIGAWRWGKAFPVGSIGQSPAMKGKIAPARTAPAAHLARRKSWRSMTPGAHKGKGLRKRMPGSAGRLPRGMAIGRTPRIARSASRIRMKRVGAARVKATTPLAGFGRAAVKATNAAGRGAVNWLTKFGYPAYMGAVVGTAYVGVSMSILSRGVNRLAERMLTATSGLAQTRPGREVTASSRTGPATPGRIMRRAGVSGNMVLDLHKTGGRGGVRT